MPFRARGPLDETFDILRQRRLVDERLRDQELVAAGCHGHPCGHVHRAADVVAFPVEHRAVVRPDAEAGELRLPSDAVAEVERANPSALAGSVKATMNSSPICLTIRPSCRGVAARTRSEKRSTTWAAAASPIESVSGVKPARSTNRMVATSSPAVSPTGVVASATWSRKS